MRFVAENIFNQVGKHAARANFNKNGSARRINIFNFLFKKHRLEDMFFQRHLNGSGVVGVRLPGGVGVHGNGRRAKRGTLDSLGKGVLRVGHQRRVERGRHRQRGYAKALGFQMLLGALHGRFGAGQNNLLI